MTARPTTPVEMVLPAFDPISGEVRSRQSWRDVRIPAAIDLDLPPRPIATHHKSAACPLGRHLFDAIKATGYETWDESAEKDTQAFRLVLTCVRCGLVESMEGVLDSNRSRTRSVDPVPLRAGTLRAQQTSPSWSRSVPSSDSWLVYDQAGAVAGCIDWARGQRGRAYYVGRLATWTDGQHIEAPTPIGCLRKLARADQAGAAD